MSGKTLEIKILKGKDLPAMDLDGTSDPYVVIKVNDKKSKTKVINSTLNPEWNETFFFDIKGDQCRILLSVYDKDLIGKDFMGQVIIPHLDTLTAFNEPVEKWYPLEKKKGNKRAKGEILVRLSVRDGPDSNFNAETAKQLSNTVNNQSSQTSIQQPTQTVLEPPPPQQSSTIPQTGPAPPPPPPPPQGTTSSPAPPPKKAPPQPPSNNFIAPPEPQNQENELSNPPQLNNVLKESFSKPPNTPPPPPPTCTSSLPQIEQVKMEYDFNALSDDQLSCVYGEVLEVVERSSEWIKLKKGDGSEGWVPLAYVSDI